MKKLLTIVVLLLALHSNSQSNIHNLVFEGAGIRGIAYSGAIKELEQRNILKDNQRVELLQAPLQLMNNGTVATQQYFSK